MSLCLSCVKCYVGWLCNVIFSCYIISWLKRLFKVIYYRWLFFLFIVLGEGVGGREKVLKKKKIFVEVIKICFNVKEKVGINLNIVFD